MNKYSYIALLFALLIGVTGGSFFVKRQDSKELNNLKEEHQKEITQQINNSKKRIKELNKIIEGRDSLLLSDSIRIVYLESKITKNKVKINKQREEIKELTTKEKEQWFTTRYSTVKGLGRPDSVHLSDTVAYLVMNDLILKDGLRYEGIVKDSIILVERHKESTYRTIIKDHELKDVEQDSVISNQDKLNKYLVQDKKDLKKDLKKEKIKNVGLKLIVIGEAIITILILI